MGAAAGVEDTPVDLRGALPDPGEPPPHIFPGLLVPLLPTVATLGLVDSMERG